MIVVKLKDLEYLPASHEDPQNPGVWKKILFKKDNLKKGRIQMINWTKLPAGSSFKKHHHEDMDEIFIILNGKVIIKVDDKEAELETGDAVLTAMKQTHKMINICNEDVMYIALGIARGQKGKTIITE